MSSFRCCPLRRGPRRVMARLGGRIVDRLTGSLTFRIRTEITMQPLRLTGVLMGAIAGLFVLWLLSVPSGAFASNFWSLRSTLVLGTGVLAMGLMSIGVILAARPVVFETALGGLDKFYRLHKWLGIAVLALSVAHWVLRKSPSWITALQLYSLPPRAPRAAYVSTGFDLLHDLREPAAEVGDWSFYVLVALAGLALWRAFPYKYFFKTHRLMAVVYLLLVFHAVILMDPNYWTLPIGPVIGALMAAGSVAALLSLTGRIGYSRRASGVISKLRQHDSNGVLEVGVNLATEWPGHVTGQYAFVNFDDAEDAHPFTISNAWQNDGQLQFTIKGLGDYTRTLGRALKIGQGVVIEGPYGRFNFLGEDRRQIWIGGGVGVTPFLSRLKGLIALGHKAPIDLFYATNAPDPGFIAEVRRLADAADVRLHVLVDAKDGRLTLDRLEAAVPDWKQADIWFCGPLTFGRALRVPMIAQGLSAVQFHQELFEMR